MTNVRSCLGAMLFGLVMSGALAQTHETQHTLRYYASAAKPKATVKDIAWLAGAWEGTAFGGISEEIWSEPLAHTMMGVYRSIERGTVKFYEIDTIVETKGSLEMRLKHFRPDLTGWEGRNVVRVFPLIALSEGKLFFDGMTYEKAGTDGVRVYLAVGGQGRRTREVVFAYRRKRM